MRSLTVGWLRRSRAAPRPKLPASATAWNTLRSSSDRGTGKSYGRPSRRRPFRAGSRLATLVLVAAFTSAGMAAEHRRLGAAVTEMVAAYAAALGDRPVCSSAPPAELLAVVDGPLREERTDA